MLKNKLKGTSFNNLLTCVVTFIVFIVLIILANNKILNSKYSALIIPVGIYVIMAVSLNLTVGILGELSLGHAGFMCIGAYVGGIFSILTQNSFSSPILRFIIAIILGGLVAGIFGLFIGTSVLRLRGDYLAIVTLGFGEIIKSITNNIYLAKDINGLHFSFASPITGLDLKTKQDIAKGAQGLQAPKTTTAIIVLVVLMITLILIMTLINSKTGRACMAVRDNYIAAQSVGINVSKYRLIAFSVSSVFAGVAGVLYSSFYAVTSSSKFDYNLSILILVYVVLGGLGSIRGSIIATIILYVLPEVFRDFQKYRMLLYAIALILIMIFNNSPRIATLREVAVAKFKTMFFKKKGADENGDA